MMQETPSSEGDILEYNEALEKGKEVLNSPLYEDSEYKLKYTNSFRRGFVPLDLIIKFNLQKGKKIPFKLRQEPYWYTNNQDAN